MKLEKPGCGAERGVFRVGRVGTRLFDSPMARGSRWHVNMTLVLKTIRSILPVRLMQRSEVGVVYSK